MNGIILETERLYLRQLQYEDHDIVKELLSNPEVVRYIDQPIETDAEVRQYIAQIKTYYAFFPMLGIWAIGQKSDNTIVGWFALKHLDETKDIEIGARILPQYWNKGYGSELLPKMLDYAWKAGLKKVVSVTDPNNHAPQKILLRQGFRLERKTTYYKRTVQLFSIKAPRT